MTAAVCVFLQIAVLHVKLHLPDRKEGLLAAVRLRLLNSHPVAGILRLGHRTTLQYILLLSQSHTSKVFLYSP